MPIFLRKKHVFVKSYLIFFNLIVYLIFFQTCQFCVLVSKDLKKIVDHIFGIACNPRSCLNFFFQSCVKKKNHEFENRKYYFWNTKSSMFAQKKFQLRLVTHFATILIQKSIFFNTLKRPIFQCEVFFRI